jgi:hypothetical protein
MVRSAESMARRTSIVVRGIVQVLGTITKEKKHVVTVAFSFSNGSATTDRSSFGQCSGREGTFAIVILVHVLLQDKSNNSAIPNVDCLVRDLAVTIIMLLLLLVVVVPVATN